MTPPQESDMRCATAAQCGLPSCNGGLFDSEGYPLTWRWEGGTGWVPVELWAGDRRVHPNEEVHCEWCGRTWQAADAERKAADSGARAVRSAELPDAITWSPEGGHG